MDMVPLVVGVNQPHCDLNDGSKDGCNPGPFHSDDDLVVFHANTEAHFYCQVF